MSHTATTDRFLAACRRTVIATAVALALACAVPPAASAFVPFAFPDLWAWSNPQPVGNDFYSVSMPTATDAWAVTQWGEVYASDDGGAHWWAQRSTGDELWRRVYFRNVHRGWVVGDYGAMRRTTNGGATWSTVDPGTSAHLNDVYFASSSRGWAGGSSSTLLKSTDGGATWVAKANPAPNAVSTIRFYDAARGWIGDNSGGVSWTTDGGAHWTRILLSAGHVIHDIDCVSAKRAWAVGSGGLISVTTDGGATWTPQDSPGVDDLTTVDFSDALHGWAAHRGGWPIKTTDGGAHWDTIPITGSFNAIAMPDGKHGCVVGRNTYWTTNRGFGWTLSSRNATSQDLVDVSFAAAGRGWAVGANGAIVATSDGGASWSTQTSPRAVTPSEVCAAGGGHAYIVGTDWSTVPDETGYILGTSNGGATWTTQGEFVDSWTNSVDFISPHTGWVGADNSGGNPLLKTTDGGAHWAPVPVSTFPMTYRDLDFVTSTRAWAVTNAGGISHTTDGGIIWSSQPVPVGGMLQVSFADTDHGWAAGFSGKIIHTTDGGQIWTEQTSGISGTLWDVVAVSASRAVAVSDGGVILRTIDGGVHWSQQTSHTDRDLDGTCYADGVTWIAGDGGAILARGYQPRPHVVRVSPTRVRAGKTLTIYGWGFGGSSGAKVVKIGKKTVATYVFTRDLRIKVKVPKMAAGKKAVRVWIGGVAANVTYVRVR